MGYCETSGWRADYATVFFLQPMLLWTFMFTKGPAAQNESRSRFHPLCLERSFRDEVWCRASLRPFWMRHPRTAKSFICAVLLAFWFCASTRALTQVGPGSPVFFHAASAITPRYASKVAGCGVPSAIEFLAIENRLCSTTAQLPAPGNKSKTGGDGWLQFMACTSTASSQCWPRCAPLGLHLLWGALQGQRWLTSLEGEGFPRLRLGQRGLRFRRAGQRLQPRHVVNLRLHVTAGCSR